MALNPANLVKPNGKRAEKSKTTSLSFVLVERLVYILIKVNVMPTIWRSPSAAGHSFPLPSLLVSDANISRPDRHRSTRVLATSGNHRAYAR